MIGEMKWTYQWGLQSVQSLRWSPHIIGNRGIIGGRHWSIKFPWSFQSKSISGIPKDSLPLRVRISMRFYPTPVSDRGKTRGVKRIELQWYHRVVTTAVRVWFGSEIVSSDPLRNKQPNTMIFVTFLSDFAFRPLKEEYYLERSCRCVFQKLKIFVRVPGRHLLCVCGAYK